MNRDEFERIARMLEEELGYCPHGRAALMQWIEEKVAELKGRGVPDGEAATMTLMTDYWGWIGEDD